MPMPQPQMAPASNPFAGYQQPAQQPQSQLPPQPFNLNPNPQSGMGAGQMPPPKQLMPQQTQPGYPTPGQTFPQPMPKQIVPQQTMPYFPTPFLGQVEPFDNSQFDQPGAAGLNPDIMFAPVPNQPGAPNKMDEQMFAPVPDQQPMPKQLMPQQTQPGFPTPGQTFQQPMSKKLLGQQTMPYFPTVDNGSMFNPGSFGM
jgi:hypothetical protein